MTKTMDNMKEKSVDDNNNENSIIETLSNGQKVTVRRAKLLDVRQHFNIDNLEERQVLVTSSLTQLSSDELNDLDYDDVLKLQQAAGSFLLHREDEEDSLKEEKGDEKNKKSIIRKLSNETKVTIRKPKLIDVRSHFDEENLDERQALITSSLTGIGTDDLNQLFYDDYLKLQEGAESFLYSRGKTA